MHFIISAVAILSKWALLGDFHLDEFFSLWLTFSVTCRLQTTSSGSLGVC